MVEKKTSDLTSFVELPEKAVYGMIHPVLLWASEKQNIVVVSVLTKLFMGYASFSTDHVMDALEYWKEGTEEIISVFAHKKN